MAADPNSGDWFDINSPAPPIKQPDPTDTGGAAAGGITADQINALYQQYLGRPASAQEAQGWISGQYGPPNLASITQQIASSGEAQAHSGGVASGPPTGGSLSDPAYAAKVVAYYATQPGANPSLKSDPNYWIGKLTSGELGSDMSYIIGKFNAPEGAGNPNGSPTGFDAAPPPYSSAPYTGPGYTPPPTPTSLQGNYTAPTWTGGAFTAPATPITNTPFAAPTLAELQASPNYQANLDAEQQAQQRSASARGTILSGGSQKEAAQYAATYAGNAYNSLYGQKLSTQQQNVSQEQTGVQNAFQQYQSRYGQFLDAANLGLQAQQQTQSQFGQQLGAAQSAYANPYGQYLDTTARTATDYNTNVTNQRNAALDYWNQLNDVANRGLTGASAGGNA